MTKLGLKRVSKALHSTFYFAILVGSFSNYAYAGGFQLWEQNVTSIENFHAGRAVLANDASIAFDNPAGITRIKNQQVVVGGMGIFTDMKYNGNVSTCVLGSCSFTSKGTVQAGSFTLIPDLHYVTPLTPNLGFGLSVVSPYGSDVEYGQNSFLSAIVTRARLQVVDIAPALGFNITTKLSAGLGLDIEKMSAELDSILMGNPSITKGFDTAYGYHLGALYEFTSATRAGIAYHSKVSHHLKGTSNLRGTALWSREITNVYLPPDTTLSLYHRFNPKWAVMGSVVYTQWNVVHNLVVQNIAGLSGHPVDFPMNFLNAWTFSIGADYIATDKLTLRAGAGFDQTPTRNAYRTLQLPDNDRYDVSFGGHYQLMKTLGFDLGWTRVFLKNAAINPPLHSVALFPVQQTPHGTIKASADVIGAQLTWDMV